MTSCSSSRRGSSPAVVCNSPTAGKRTNYTKAGSAPRSNFSINAVASSQVGKMSPLARYGSLKRVYNKEQERLNPNGLHLLQNPESMIQRSISHTAISQHQEDVENAYDDDGFEGLK